MTELARTIFELADHYWDGFEHSLKRLSHLNLNQNAVAPSITLAAFSIELYLKSLVAFGGEPLKRTHKYMELYASLHKTRRDTLEAAFAAELAGQEFEDLCRAIGEQAKQYRELSHVLGVNNDAFVRHRYPYDKTFKPGFVLPRTLRNALRHVCVVECDGTKAGGDPTGR